MSLPGATDSFMRFIQMGFVWFLFVGIAYCATFIIGARKRGKAAHGYHRNLGLAFWIVTFAIAAYGLFSGQMKAYIAIDGFGTLLELCAFGFGWVAFMWFLTGSYVQNRLELDAQENREDTDA